ncbi:YkgJ family cysteine cluster protein [Andreprevotia lacus]|jgi:Fe-S-cluster containining protein|nr:YkgJ family cysteine cluster protein [Andreprevotia lacus]
MRSVFIPMSNIISLHAQTATASAYAFACTACGQCCNTPPLLTLDEALRFEAQFIITLGLRRVQPLRAGQPVEGVAADVADVAAQQALFEQLLYPAANGAALQIALLATDYPTRTCPALGGDGRCTLHTAGKPLACDVVPLDALQPDRLQHAVLASRSAGFARAACISPAAAGAGQLLIDGTQVTDVGYAHDLQRHRAALAADKTAWGNALHRLLTDALRDVALWARIPQAGFYQIPPVPLLALLAADPAYGPARCAQFVRAQLALIDAALAAALQRKQAADKPFTQQLRGMAEACRSLLPRLAA